MPKNKLIYYGLLVILATAAIYVGAWLANNILFVLPYTLGAGLLMIVLGAVIENRRAKEAAASQEDKT